MRRMASLRLEFGEAFESVPLLKEAIEACEKCGERFEVGIAHRDLSRAYRELDQYQKSLRHSRKSVEIFKAMGATLELARSLLEAARSRHAWYAVRARNVDVGINTTDDNPYTAVEEAWSYSIEAFHLFADLERSEECTACEHLMKELREEGMPIWMRAAPGRADTRTLTVGKQPFIANAPSMKHLLTMVEIGSSTREPVLITGETGTGKELIARMIHDQSRIEGDFVPVNCAAIPETLFEREFFGNAKGAFTGAETPKAGLCEEADGGTLFLDEIGDMPSFLQVKLLRLLQEGTYRRLGDPQERRVELRVIAATNAPLPR